ncbi:MAG: hypothetical protein J7M39_01025, partial [Anaerolineae bacterium]|nr:hypothetical protein [Anaerolineae bacterium]
MPARPGRDHTNHSYRVRSLLCLQQTAGNRAGQRQMPPEGAGQRPDAIVDDQAFWEWWKLVAGFEGSLGDWKANPGKKSDRGGQTNWRVTKSLY